MSLQENIDEALIFIAARDPKNFFWHEVNVIKETKYAIKNKYFEPWWDQATTWGTRYVRLMYNFYSLSPLDKAAILIHESIHELQYEAQGTFNFWLKYLKNHLKVGYFNNPFEMEALRRENAFRMLGG